MYYYSQLQASGSCISDRKTMQEQCASTCGICLNTSYTGVPIEYYNIIIYYDIELLL